MAARRGKNQARRNGRNGTRPAWVWVVAGLAIGAVAFLVVPALMKGDGDGFARFGPRANPDAQTREWRIDGASFSDDDLANPVVEGRLRRHDCSQITDGGAAVEAGQTTPSAAATRLLGYLG